MLDHEPTPEDPSAAALPPAPRRNDSISPIAVVVLIVFWVLQSSFVTLPTISRHRGAIARRSNATETGTGMSSDVETGILDIDLQAKSSYVASGYVSNPDLSAPSALAGVIGSKLTRASAKARHAALAEALRLFSKSPQDPSLARRVILLRAETGAPDPLGPLPVFGARAGAPLRQVYPLDAYNSFATASPLIQAVGENEKQAWQTLFAPGASFSASQSAALAARIRSMDNLRWWTYLALHQLYVRAGETSLAGGALKEAVTDADESVALTSALSTISIICILIGVIAILMLVGRWAGGPDAPGGFDGNSLRPARLLPVIGGVTQIPEASGSIFDETPALIADEDRKLGAGDLANLFALYLILMMGVQLAAPFLLGGPLGRAVASATTESKQVTLVIFAEAIVVAFCGVATFVALLWLAKIRGANLGNEIGLNAGGRPLMRVVAFGLLGWCISLPLLIVVGALAKMVFHNAPSPANPAIPLLMATPGGIAAIVLYVLVAVLAPLFEETVFRGLFYNAARLRVGVRPAIVLTGLAFGLSHSVGIAEQLSLAVLGGVLAWLAQTRKSLMPGMVLHCLQNSFAYALLLFTLMTMVAKMPILQ